MGVSKFRAVAAELPVAEAPREVWTRSSFHEARLYSSEMEAARVVKVASSRHLPRVKVNRVPSSRRLPSNRNLRQLRHRQTVLS